MQCYVAFQRTQQANLQNLFAFMNYLQDEMSFLAGLPSTGPRIRIPQPTYLGTTTMNTTNNIRVEPGSHVGQINAGALVYLNKAVTAFDTAGLSNLASALRDFTQQVVDSQELSAESQQQTLDSLKFVMQELHKKDRNTSMLKLALANIGTLASGVSSIAEHWDKLKNLLEHLVK
jgi:hypothetical protein